MEPRMDRRIQYTKMILREALLDLMSTKTLNEISISGLCRSADVNRSTFYKYYASPHEILQELEAMLYEEMAEAIQHASDLEQVIRTACRSLEANKKMSVLLFSRPVSETLLTKVLSSVKAVPGFGPHGQQQNTSSAAGSMIYAFSEGGAVAIIREWVRSGFQVPADSVAALVTFLVKNVYASAESYPK